MFPRGIGIAAILIYGALEFGHDEYRTKIAEHFSVSLRGFSRISYFTVGNQKAGDSIDNGSRDYWHT